MNEFSCQTFFFLLDLFGQGGSLGHVFLGWYRPIYTWLKWYNDPIAVFGCSCLEEFLRSFFFRSFFSVRIFVFLWVYLFAWIYTQYSVIIIATPVIHMSGRSILNTALRAYANPTLVVAQLPHNKLPRHITTPVFKPMMTTDKTLPKKIQTIDTRAPRPSTPFASSQIDRTCMLPCNLRIICR